MSRQQLIQPGCTIRRATRLHVLSGQIGAADLADGSGAIATVRRVGRRSHATKATGSRHWASRGPSSRAYNARSVAPIKTLGAPSRSSRRLCQYEGARRRRPAARLCLCFQALDGPICGLIMLFHLGSWGNILITGRDYPI